MFSCVKFPAGSCRLCIYELVNDHVKLSNIQVNYFAVVVVGIITSSRSMLEKSWLRMVWERFAMKGRFLMHFVVIAPQIRMARMRIRPMMVGLLVT